MVISAQPAIDYLIFHLDLWGSTYGSKKILRQVKSLDGDYVQGFHNIFLKSAVFTVCMYPYDFWSIRTPAGMLRLTIASLTVGVTGRMESWTGCNGPPHQPSSPFRCCGSGQSKKLPSLLYYFFFFLSALSGALVFILFYNIHTYPAGHFFIFFFKFFRF